MAILQVRGIDSGLYQSLKNRATREKRSISQEVIFILEKYLARPKSMDVNPTEEFLQLSGSWEDDHSAEEIVASIRDGRIDSPRFIIETFGHLKATLEKTGRIVADMDLIIASTALTHNLVLVTNNEKHFQHVPELQVENWAT